MDQLLPNIPRQSVRRLESLAVKLANAKSALMFNTACYREGLTPNYLQHNISTHGHRGINDSQKTSIRDALQREIHEIKTKATNLSSSIVGNIAHLHRNFRDVSTDAFQRPAYNIVDHHFAKKRIVILNKLSRLCSRPFALPDGRDRSVNLSKYQPSHDEKEFLNLGYTYHIPRDYDPIIKQSGFVRTTPRLEDLLRLEGRTHRQHVPSFPPNIRAAGKTLRLNPDIVLRRADKSSSYVIMDRCAYHAAIDHILSDNTKFRRLRSDPTETVKREANVLINRMGPPFRQIVGDYKPGYIYGNVKLHKTGNPLRPIISQIPAPIHSVAKVLAAVLAPFWPETYRIKSSTDLLDILRERHPTNTSIASLDVVSLFTNIPVLDTIDIIISRVYGHPTLRPPSFDFTDLIHLLKLCTCRLPFYHPDGRIYQQIMEPLMTNRSTASPWDCHLYPFSPTSTSDTLRPRSSPASPTAS